ncbi:hypothetical protein NX059_012409 [Plenodomus lindquistii]|nr:hypothetical protein NX059_012409 [Plenodomus lindquistii]
MSREQRDHHAVSAQARRAGLPTRLDNPPTRGRAKGLDLRSVVKASSRHAPEPGRPVHYPRSSTPIGGNKGTCHVRFRSYRLKADVIAENRAPILDDSATDDNHGHDATRVKVTQPISNTTRPRDRSEVREYLCNRKNEHPQDRSGHYGASPPVPSAVPRSSHRSIPAPATAGDKDADGRNPSSTVNVPPPPVSKGSENPTHHPPKTGQATSPNPRFETAHADDQSASQDPASTFARRQNHPPQHQYSQGQSSLGIPPEHGLQASDIEAVIRRQCEWMLTELIDDKEASAAAFTKLVRQQAEHEVRRSECIRLARELKETKEKMSEAGRELKETKEKMSEAERLAKEDIQGLEHNVSQRDRDVIQAEERLQQSRVSLDKAQDQKKILETRLFERAAEEKQEANAREDAANAASKERERLIQENAQHVAVTKSMAEEIDRSREVVLDLQSQLKAVDERARQAETARQSDDARLLQEELRKLQAQLQAGKQEQQEQQERQQKHLMEMHEKLVQMIENQGDKTPEWTTNLLMQITEIVKVVPARLFDNEADVAAADNATDQRQKLPNVVLVSELAQLTKLTVDNDNLVQQLKRNKEVAAQSVSEELLNERKLHEITRSSMKLVRDNARIMERNYKMTLERRNGQILVYKSTIQHLQRTEEHWKTRSQSFEAQLQALRSSTLNTRNSEQSPNNNDTASHEPAVILVSEKKPESSGWLSSFRRGKSEEPQVDDQAGGPQNPPLGGVIAGMGWRNPFRRGKPETPHVDDQAEDPETSRVDGQAENPETPQVDDQAGGPQNPPLGGVIAGMGWRNPFRRGKPETPHVDDQAEDPETPRVDGQAENPETPRVDGQAEGQGNTPPGSWNFPS